MNRRGKRLTLGVMVVGLAVVVGLAIAHWGTVRDHVEAWHFQLTYRNETITPGFRKPTEDQPTVGLEYYTVALEYYEYSTPTLFRLLAEHSGLPVIHPPQEIKEVYSSPTELAFQSGEPTVEEVRRLLQANGWCVIEQRFPRRAYVVIWDEGAPQ
jgi:hypothetical protein